MLTPDEIVNAYYDGILSRREVAFRLMIDHEWSEAEVAYLLGQQADA